MEIFKILFKIRRVLILDKFKGVFAQGATGLL